jgi:hypothetical protein
MIADAAEILRHAAAIDAIRYAELRRDAIIEIHAFDTLMMLPLR